MKFIIVTLLLVAFYFSFGQSKGDDKSIIKLEVWRDSILDKTDSIKLIQIITYDTLITIKLFDIRSVKKLPLDLDNEDHLKLIIGNDTMTFSFLNPHDYISTESPVSVWTIRIFSDLNYTKKYFTKRSDFNNLKNFRKIYSFTCDWCTAESVSPRE